MINLKNQSEGDNIAARINLNIRHKFWGNSSIKQLVVLTDRKCYCKKRDRGNR